jgi:hypothetical protein
MTAKDTSQITTALPQQVDPASKTGLSIPSPSGGCCKTRKALLPPGGGLARVLNTNFIIIKKL